MVRTKKYRLVADVRLCLIGLPNPVASFSATDSRYAGRKPQSTTFKIVIMM
jgi:hypothetical protein